MPLYITSLNSGSNGNCYYVGNDNEAILIDAGLSCRETEKRMKRLGLSLENVKAIFVSHEHTDHIKGIPVIAHKYQLPIYITAGTLKNWGVDLPEQLVFNFCAYQPVKIGGLSITAFPKFHDAADPHSFIICGEGLTIGVFTDIGVPCENLIHHFSLCHAAFLESNYDELMLENGGYPIYLKNRIRNGQGHLSNRQALEIFNMYKPSFMSHLLLSHLSQNNNNPDLVFDLFNGSCDGVKIVVASRYEETKLYTIDAGFHSPEKCVELPNLVSAVVPAVTVASIVSITTATEATMDPSEPVAIQAVAVTGRHPRKKLADVDPNQYSLF